MKALHLLEFYGQECPHCERIRKTLDDVEKEIGMEVTRVEIWHDSDNEKLMEKYDKGFCGGVPFLYNTESEGWICGEATKEQLVAWAKGELKNNA
jgi:glutaredoxin